MFSPAVLLLIAAITLRAWFWYRQGSSFSLAVGLFAAYLLLYAGSSMLKYLGTIKWLAHASQALYLYIQAALVAQMLLLLPLNDFCSLLFVPLSIQAVQFYRRRLGSAVILSFTVLMAAILVRGGDKFPGGLIMSLLFGGVCFLAGSYSHLIQGAEETRLKNQRTLEELQVAHQQLQKYAQQRQELAAEKERHRLANELHDSVTQNIFSMNLATQTARVLMSRNDHGVEAVLVRMQTLAQIVMGEIQAVASQLRPLPDTRSGLANNVRKLAATKNDLEGLQVQVVMQGEDSLPPHIADGLFHIIQEALNNVVKHSRANQAVVRLNFDDSPFSIEIEDCGVGFDPDLVQNLPGHFGLATMAEQAREIGWELTVESRINQGSRIKVEQGLSGGNDGQAA